MFDTTYNTVIKESQCNASSVVADIVQGLCCTDGVAVASPGKLKVKAHTFIYRHLQGNPVQERFTMQSGELTGNDTGGVAQVAAAHCQCSL